MYIYIHFSSTHLKLESENIPAHKVELSKRIQLSGYTLCGTLYVYQDVSHEIIVNLSEFFLFLVCLFFFFCFPTCTERQLLMNYIKNQYFIWLVLVFLIEKETKSLHSALLKVMNLRNIYDLSCSCSGVLFQDKLELRSGASIKQDYSKTVTAMISLWINYNYTKC